MIRRQRRSAAKMKPPVPPLRQEIAKDIPEAKPLPRVKPGFLLRMFAKILLAPWVLKRVRHTDVERLIAGVAVQAGRPEIAAELLNRIVLRNDGKR